MNVIMYERALRESFDDKVISKSEKTALHKLFEELKEDHEALNFLRNRAFDIVNEYAQKNKRDIKSAMKWLEDVIRLVDNEREVEEIKSSKACFSPGKNCSEQIRSLIRNAEHKIDICVFTISDDDISGEILEAKKRGVNVRIITDDDKSHDMGSDISKFIEQGINVEMDHSSAHMHHKFAIFDREALVNGSFNWTKSASDYNQENIVVLYEPKLINMFQDEFNKLWKKFKDI